MESSRGIPLGLRLVAVLLLGGVASTALFLHAYVRERDRVQATAERELVSLVQLAAGQDQQLVEGVRVLLRYLATQPEIRSTDAAACAAVLRRAVEREPEVYSVAVASTSGEVRCASHEALQRLHVADLPFFQKTLSSGEFSAGTYALDRATSQAAIHFAYPLVEDGQISAVIFLALDLEWLDGFVQRISLPSGSAMVAWDEEGTVLAGFPDPARWLGRSLAGTPVFEESRRRDRGFLRMPDWAGEEFLWSFTGVGSRALERGLHLGLAVPEEALVAQLEQDLRAHLVLLWLVGLVAAGLLLLATWAWVIRPLRRVERAATALADGRLEARAGVPDAPGELGRVSAAFDTMAAAFERDTHSREDFIDLVAHELKTPLTTFKLQLQRLRLAVDRGDPVSGEAVMRAVDAADRQGWRLARLVESLLDSRALSEGARRLELERFELSGVVADVVARHRPTFEAASGALAVDVKGPIDGVWDRALVVQLLHQLLSNALRYGEGRPVSLSAEAEAGQVRLVVRDLGIGIRLEDQRRIFERFERGTADSSHGGLGLGLWVVRQIVRRMQGEVVLRSRPGEGATFIVTLPQDLSAATAAPAWTPGRAPPVEHLLQ